LSATNISHSSNENDIIYSKQLSVWICIFQRIIQAVAITVETLAEIRQLYVVIGGKETAEDGVVEAAVHVDEAELGHHLMACISTVEVESVIETDAFA
jgi:hypothetical protein